MFGKYLLPIVLLVGVILFSSIVTPILNGIENFESESEKLPGMLTPLICPGCKGDGKCTCYQTNIMGDFDETKGVEYDIRKGSLDGGVFDRRQPVEEGMSNMNKLDETSGIMCLKCHTDAKLCECVHYTDRNKGDRTKKYLASVSQSDKTTSLSSTTPTNAVSTIGTSGTVDPILQGKHPMPYSDLVDIVKKNEEVEERQSKHIEDIRKVLANTITSLEKDDVLPSGSHCSCASAPVIDPLTGEVDLTDGCKPPGWLRMMNSRNARDEECSN